MYLNMTACMAKRISPWVLNNKVEKQDVQMHDNKTSKIICIYYIANTHS